MGDFLFQLHLSQTVSTRKVLKCPNFHWDKTSKEVIHPHLPVRIPCYDLTLIAEFTLVLENLRLQVPSTLLI